MYNINFKSLAYAYVRCMLSNKCTVTHLCFLFHLRIVTVSFNQLAYSVDEDAGAVWPALVLSDLSVTDVFVQVLTISGSASGKFIRIFKIKLYNLVLGGGIDYIAGPYTVKVPAGKVNASFRISITNDNKKEINETFRLIIDSSSLPDGVVVGSRGQALITIVDKTRTSKMAL